jgi:hypothetical protein
VSGETRPPGIYPWFRRLLTPARIWAVVAALAVVIGFAIEVRREPARSATASFRPTPHASVSAGAESPSAWLHRPRYRHSVILGGAFTGQEVESVVRQDAVVAMHYRGVNLTELRPALVREPRHVYVSYRLGDRVYWTKKQARLAVGETLLTDGAHAIRARCGNRISDVPHGPVSDVEPFEELDELEDSVTGERAPLASTPGAMTYVPFLSLIQQSLVGDGWNAPIDAAIWPVPPVLLILTTTGPQGAATVWGEPVVVPGGPGGGTGTDGELWSGGGGGSQPPTTVNPGSEVVTVTAGSTGTTGDVPEIPEPGILMMLGAAASAALWARRRHR